MKGIVKKPGKPLEVVELGEANKLREMQRIVGGMIEIIPLSGKVRIICNEEGRYEKLPPNCGLLGTLLFLAEIDAGDGMTDSGGLTDAQIQIAKDWIEMNA